MIITDIRINAKREEVWSVLTNPSTFDKWNPLIENISGELTPGNEIEVKLRVMKKSMKATVITYEENKLLIWKSKLVPDFLFHAIHLFSLTTLGETTLLEHSEEYKGIIGRIIPSKSLSPILSLFEDHNSKLKKYVEQMSTV